MDGSPASTCRWIGRRAPAACGPPTVSDRDRCGATRLHSTTLTATRSSRFFAPQGAARRSQQTSHAQPADRADTARGIMRGAQPGASRGSSGWPDRHRPTHRHERGQDGNAVDGEHMPGAVPPASGPMRASKFSFARRYTRASCAGISGISTLPLTRRKLCGFFLIIARRLCDPPQGLLRFPSCHRAAPQKNHTPSTIRDTTV